MQTKNYNLIPLSIDNGLNRVPVGTAGGYIRLLDAPAIANVKIHLNNKNADGIPLKTYHAIEATNIEKIFVSCNSVVGESITIVQANTAKDFKMVTPASDVKLSSLGSYESVALQQLDKIINPYYPPALIISGQACNTSRTIIFNKTLNCDKIKIDLSFFYATSIDGRGYIRAILNGATILLAGGHYDANGRSITPNSSIEIENCNGMTLVIENIADISSRYCSYCISEYKLK